MPSSAIEDYVKQLYFLEQQQGAEDALVPMGQLATAMGVVPGTATTMVKTLATAGLVDYRPRVGVRLSKNGLNLALHVLRRHRLVELFLVKVLGLDWSEVHEEAEALEHVISDRVLERMDTLLDFPTDDPHGAPIPSADGVLPERNDMALDQIAHDRPVEVVRVQDSDGDFLQFLSRFDIKPGTVLKVISREDAAGTLSLAVDAAEIPLPMSHPAAKRIRVRPV